MMVRWNNRLFPYPLLAQWTDDYGERGFGVKLNAISSGRNINLGIAFENESSYLNRLIEDRRAQYALAITCPATAGREIITSRFAEIPYSLEAEDYAVEIESVPYIVSVEDIDRFVSDEHAEEFRDAVPDGFTVPIGGILAVGSGVRTSIVTEEDAKSVIDLVSDEKVPSGQLVVELDHDRIQIVLSVKDKARVEVLRLRPNSSPGFTLLYAGLYLPTLTEAIRNMTEHDGRRWVTVIRNALSNREVDLSDTETIEESALTYAQKLLEMPIGRSLTAFAEEYQDD